METVIRKWGNSPALRVPTAVLKEAGYQLEQKVDLVVSRARPQDPPFAPVDTQLLSGLLWAHAGRDCYPIFE